jgi:hypothetical protein
MLAVLFHGLGLISCGVTARIWYLMIQRSMSARWTLLKRFSTTQETIYETKQRSAELLRQSVVISCLSREEKNDERGGGRQMQQDLGGVGNDTVAYRQRMRFAEHSLKALRALRFRFEEIGHPPSAELPHEEQAVANP